MAPRNKQALLDQALALPDAQPSDFFAGRKPPADVHPHQLKVIKDTVLRARLIGARLAEGLQSPKGPQKIPSILRIYPDFDAPATISPNGHAPVRATGKPGRKPLPQPTVEDMEALITRIRALEGHVAREVSMTVDQEIEQLQRRVASAHSAEELKATVAELGAAIAKRNDSRAHVRAEAYKRIEHDSAFAPRAFLKLLARPQ